jgi:glycosyltransferase involved in cell wall biosynthesis
LAAALWHQFELGKLDMEILLIGPYPPPIGGNSVHVQRLLNLLIKDGNNVHVFDMFSKSPERRHPNLIVAGETVIQQLINLLKLAFTSPAKGIIHFHVSGMRRFRWLAPLLLLLFLRQAKIITIHSGSFVAESNNLISRIFLRLLVYLCKEIIVVNLGQADFLLKLGTAQEKLTVIPAFLPQDSSSELIPPEIMALAGGKKLVLTSGYLTPLYNYDVLIDCIEELAEEDFHIVFAFYHTVDENYSTHILKRLSQFKNITILRDKTPEVFVSIMSVVDVYVRSTLTDGDAVAIREALAYGKIVLASDCVERPKEAHLFSDNKALLDLLVQISANTLPTQASSTESYFDAIKNVYSRVNSSR